MTDLTDLDNFHTELQTRLNAPRDETAEALRKKMAAILKEHKEKNMKLVKEGNRMVYKEKLNEDEKITTTSKQHTCPTCGTLIP